MQQGQKLPSFGKRVLWPLNPFRNHAHMPEKRVYFVRILRKNINDGKKGLFFVKHTDLVVPYGYGVRWRGGLFQKRRG